MITIYRDLGEFLGVEMRLIGRFSFFFQAEDGIRDLVRSRGLGDVYKRQGINLGIQKQFLNKKASIKLSATDLFWTNLPKANIQYRDYFERFVVKRETRVVSCSFNYRFGNTKIAGNRKRVSGAEDEKKRASSGQG